MPKRKPTTVQMPSAQSEDQPATRKMLYLVRDELKGEIRSLESKIESRFQGVESRFLGFESRFERLEAGNTRLQLLIEEQNANNRIVLEGLQGLWQRQAKIEKILR